MVVPSPATATIRTRPWTRRPWRCASSAKPNAWPSPYPGTAASSTGMAARPPWCSLRGAGRTTGSPGTVSPREEKSKRVNFLSVVWLSDTNIMYINMMSFTRRVVMHIAHVMTMCFLETPRQIPRPYEFYDPFRRFGYRLYGVTYLSRLLLVSDV